MFKQSRRLFQLSVHFPCILPCAEEKKSSEKLPVICRDRGGFLFAILPGKVKTFYFICMYILHIAAVSLIQCKCYSDKIIQCQTFNKKIIGFCFNRRSRSTLPLPPPQNFAKLFRTWLLDFQKIQKTILCKIKFRRNFARKFYSDAELERIFFIYRKSFAYFRLLPNF